MKRYILNRDDTQTPPAGTRARAEVVSGLLDFHKKGSGILEAKNPYTYPPVNKIVVHQGSLFFLFNGEWRSFEVDQETELGAADLDTGSAFRVGADYYVYLVDSGGGALVISENSTYPEGRSTDNSRKIGGFHYGHVRCVMPIRDGMIPVSPEGQKLDNNGLWKNNVVTGIVPNSVWDLHNRPLCSPEGMVRTGNIWIDIYPSSAAEAITFENSVNGLFVKDGLLQSKYGQFPTTGTEGLHWYNFIELAARSGKRLLSYGEWCRGAYGNPGGQDNNNQYGWTKASNSDRTRTGCNIDQNTGLYVPAGGIKPYAVSAFNLVDTVGNTWEWINEHTIRQDSTAWTWQNILGTDKGQAYLPNTSGLSAIFCGGGWGSGVYAGPRAVHLGNRPWDVSVNIGCRLACDKLAA